MKEYKIISNEKAIGNIIEQHKTDGSFVANITINKVQIIGQKPFSDLMQAPILNVVSEVIRTKTKNELDKYIIDFIGKYIKDRFEIIEQ